jgi:FtsP/CotA-like multicopper oxidase with cupredoxin domain
MYSPLSNLEMLFLFLMLLLGWTAGNQASKLTYRVSGRRLRRSVRRLLGMSALLTAACAATAGIVTDMACTLDPLFWLDRLLLHVPLTAVPVLYVWLSAAPKLVRLLRTAREAEAAGAGPQPSVRRLAAEPGLIVPCQAAALGALTALYFALRPPVPFRTMEVAVPLLLFAGAVSALWYRHSLRCRAIGSSAADPALPPLWKRGLRNLAILAAVVALAALPWTAGMRNSLLPERIDMTAEPMDDGKGHIGYHETGRHAAHAQAQVSVADLTGPRAGEPDRRITLTAEKKTVRLNSGKTVEAWTFNGQIPGPELRVKQGELVEVTLVNRNVEAGVTIHWHGLDVPNAEDGVAGVTQDAVMPGERHTYRFRAEQSGTFWYHTHQDSLEGVGKGLFGPLIVEPANPDGDRTPVKDITVMTHEWFGAGLAIGDADTIRQVRVAPGTPVRLRLVNTDNWVRRQYQVIGSAFQVAAIDGTDVHEPGELADGTRLVLTTGGRYDVTFVMPDRPVFLKVAGNAQLGLVLSPGGTAELPEAPAVSPAFDPLHYGAPAPTPFGKDSRFDREFTVILDNKLGLFNGVFQPLYTLNGEVFPNVPAFMVEQGDLVKTTIVNRGQADHPMHLHGHHVLVLSRNGEAAGGSPWWSDTLDVLPGDRYEIAFRADNPGIWMDHCHNLAHAAAGMTMHLMYEGVTTPYEAGRFSGNRPE